MLTSSRWLALLLFAIAWLPLPVHAQVPVAVGQWIQLRATNPQGVPLHREAGPSLIAPRAPDGARAEILELADEGHWIKIRLRLPAGLAERWIIERYVARVVDGPPPPGSSTADQGTVWGSEAGCRTVVTAGRRAAPTRADMLRVATWNVRWFPDETNVAWLACVIAWMNLDLLAVEEIRDTDDARAAMTLVLEQLATLTSNIWSVDLHDCGARPAQHVGFVWNTTRVELTGPRDVWEMNARATELTSPCVGSLRPGRYAKVKGTGNGIDFQAVVVHLKSGSDASARAERVTALGRLEGLVTTLRGEDADIVVLGDFNSMGDGTTGSAANEIQHVFTAAAGAGLVRLPVQPACSEYFQGKPGWIDHVLVSQAMIGLVSTTARLEGYCAVKNCADIGNEKPAAYQQLSDHCPVVVEIRNQDLD